MSWNITRVRAELQLALSAVYGVRMQTAHSRWTPEQVEMIVAIERDLVKLRESLKGGWST